MAQEIIWDSALYDDKHSFVWKLAGVLDLLKTQADERILDVGCWTGHLTAKIASVGAICTGIDQSPDMIRQARETYPRLQFQVMDAREITFTESFDAVFSMPLCIGSRNQNASSPALLVSFAGVAVSLPNSAARAIRHNFSPLLPVRGRVQDSPVPCPIHGSRIR